MHVNTKYMQNMKIENVLSETTFKHILSNGTIILSSHTFCILALALTFSIDATNFYNIFFFLLQTTDNNHFWSSGCQMKWIWTIFEIVKKNYYANYSSIEKYITKTNFC